MRLRDYRPIIECVGRPGRFPGRPLEGATVSLARTRVSAPTDAGRTERRKIGASLPTIDADRLAAFTPPA